MIRIVRKGIITKYFLPYLSVAQRGYVSKVPLWEIVHAIIYKLKTGVQWHLLPCKSLIRSNKVKYGAIYHHFNKWSKDGSWEKAWTSFLEAYKSFLDMSLTALDGTHTPAKKGGEAVGYQHRKKCKTSNTIWLTDRTGKVVAFLPAVSGNHNDLYRLVELLDELVKRLKKSGISVDGLFLNADAGFDSKAFREACQRYGIVLNAPINPRNHKQIDNYDIYFDDLMYEQRYTIERTNAWMDAYKTLLVRMDTSFSSWNAWHYIYAMLNFLKSIRLV